MKETIYLEAALDKDFLKIGIHVPDRTMRTYEELSVPMDRIEKHCRKMVETLNRHSRKGGKTPDSAESIKTVGRMLCDDLLTPRIKSRLETSTAAYLILSLDDHLVHIPWELLYVGNDFLCRRFNTGRWVRTRQSVTDVAHRPMEKPLEMWILANPQNDLPEALSEGMKIFRCTNQRNSDEVRINPSLDSDIRPDRIRMKIKDYDLLHFAGHAEYHPGGPGTSGWRLTEGHFRADDIYKMAGGSPMPALVFSNACQSARTEPWEWKKDVKAASFGLANAFLFAGVRHYLGTFWEIVDEPSGKFALEFYQHLLSGETVGESVRAARLALAEEYGADSAGWASYLLYGDPRFSYFGRNEALEDPGNPDMLCIASSADNSKVRTAFSDSQETPLSDNGKEDGADERPPGKRRNIKIWLTALLAGAVLMTVGMIMGDRRETQRFMAEQAGKKQAQICQLIDKLEQRISYPLEPSPNSTTSESLTLAIMYDSVKSAYYQGREAIISSAIENEIKNEYPRIKLVERKELKLILEELYLAMSALTPAKNRLRPDLLNAKLILLVETDHSFFQAFVSMRLFDTETGEVIFSSVEKLKSGRLASQNMAKHLLKTLKSHYSER